MASPLRLTLRTLLSYLDDTLDPGQAKLIGQKVAESEQARELMDRIRQVTRRRRLTTPPAAGPGGIDANTIAEYLDNEVTPEQAEEVESICLASDVHLAEVAACHQILTLVLGEPALVPPSARQRMYGLVKGPEAIPFRKPPKANPKTDLDLSTSDAGLEHDDSMRMPAFARASGMRNTLLLSGGGILAALLLVFALWKIFSTTGGTDENPPPNNQQIAAVTGQAETKPDKTVTDKKPGQEKQPVEVTPPIEDKKDKSKPPEQKKQPSTDTKPPEEKPVTAIVTGEEVIPLTPPDVKPVFLGMYEPNPKSPNVLLQKEAGPKGAWVRFFGKNLEVASARPLMALPGNRSDIQLKTGLHLTLWGTTPEIWPFPYLYESMVELYAHPVLALDMTLRRGRVLVTNTRSDNKPVMLRVRCDDPLQKEQETFTLSLMEKGTTAMIERVAFFPEDEPFYDNATDKNRKGPTVVLGMHLLNGIGYAKWGDIGATVDARTKPQMMYWESTGGMTRGPLPIPEPDWLEAKPKQGDPKARTYALQAVQLLAKNLKGNPLDVTLREALDNSDLNKTAQATQRLALLCYTALDQFDVPLEMLSKEETSPYLRRTAVYALRNWMAQSPGNEYLIYDRLKGEKEMNYPRPVARKIMELLHGISRQDAANPATYQRLIDDLNNSELLLRELSAWNLETLVPAGRSIAAEYHSTDPAPRRVAIQAAWRQLIPPERLPPAPGEPTKKK